MVREQALRDSWMGGEKIVIGTKGKQKIIVCWREIAPLASN